MHNALQWGQQKYVTKIIKTYFIATIRYAHEHWYLILFLRRKGKFHLEPEIYIYVVFYLPLVTGLPLDRAPELKSHFLIWSPVWNILWSPFQTPDHSAPDLPLDQCRSRRTPASLTVTTRQWNSSWNHAEKGQTPLLILFCVSGVFKNEVSWAATIIVSFP